MSGTRGEAARLDDAAADREHAEALGAEMAFGRLMCLLKLARAALGPEWHVLAAQIDDELYGRTPDADDELVLESYGQGHAWFRRAAA